MGMLHEYSCKIGLGEHLLSAFVITHILVSEFPLPRLPFPRLPKNGHQPGYAPSFREPIDDLRLVWATKRHSNALTSDSLSHSPSL